MDHTNDAVKRDGDNLSAIRLLAAIIVIYGHAFPLTGGHAPGYLGSGIQTIAVKVFFVISGMLITESWMRDRNLIRYFQRRLLRIIPALFVVCTATVFIVGPIVSSQSVGSYFSNGATYQYLKNVLFYPVYVLPGVFNDNIYPSAVNGSLWTLPVEMAMYIAVPAIIVLTKWSRLSIIVILGAVATVSILALRGDQPWEAVVFYGTNLWTAAEITPYFLAGMLITAYNLKRYANIQIAFVIMIVAPIFAISPAVAEMALLVTLPFLVISFAYAPNAYFSFMDKMGDISYGVYLYAFLFQQIASQYFVLAHGPIMNFLIALVPTIGVAALSWKFVEKPALSLKPKSKSGKISTVSKSQ